MINRLTEKIREAGKHKQKLFCAYLTLGFPNLKATGVLVPALERAGVDILELGFPFSDPLADGPTIQFTSQEAIERGVKLKDAFALIRKLRKRGLRIPVLFFSYMNPIMHYGISQALRQLHQSGFDGLIVPDLPPEEGRMWASWFQRFDLSLVYLVAPTTGENRMREIIKRSSGFIYYVSLRGVTGARNALSTDLFRKLKEIKKITRKPVLVGFGVSNETQARRIARASDGIIVGSAIMDRLRSGRGGVRSVIGFVSRLVKAVKSTSPPSTKRRDTATVMR